MCVTADEACVIAQGLAKSFNYRDLDTLESEGLFVYVQHPDLEKGALIHYMRLQMKHVICRDKGAFRCAAKDVKVCSTEDAGELAVDFMPTPEALDILCADVLDRVIAESLYRGYSLRDIVKASKSLTLAKIRTRVENMRERWIKYEQRLKSPVSV